MIDDPHTKRTMTYQNRVYGLEEGGQELARWKGIPFDTPDGQQFWTWVNEWMARGTMLDQIQAKARAFPPPPPRRF